MVEPDHAVHTTAVHANAVHTNAPYAAAAERQEALASQLRQRNDHANQAHNTPGLAAQPQSPLQRLQALADASPQVAQLQRLQSLVDASPHVAQLQRLQALVDASPQVAQLKRLQALADAASLGALQPKSPLQRKSPEEEELLKGRSRTAQRKSPQDDELLKRSSRTAQRKSPKDDELLQGKFATSQSAPHQLQASPNAATAAPNRTGMPDGLKSGIESLSGLSMEHVRVHYNSSKPAQLNAHAYAQGSDIHLAPGQDQHLPHEAWHLVQQAQGRVRPTLQLNGGVAVNDDPGLEREADQMGARAQSAGG